MSLFHNSAMQSAQEILICSTPPHLHSNGRDPDPHFDDDEKIYRRFTHGIDQEPWHGIKEELRLRKDSACRAKYMRTPDDTRWRNDGVYAAGTSVFMLTVQAYCAITVSLSDGRVYSIRPRHDPLQCMYPHTELDVICNGTVVSHDAIAKSARALLRDAIQRACIVVA
jgi:hypothetical protein